MSGGVTIIISNASIILTTVILNPIFTIPNIIPNMCQSCPYCSPNPNPIWNPAFPRSGLCLGNTSIPLVPFRLTTRGKQIFDLPRQVRSVFASLIDCIRAITTLDITSHSIQDTRAVSGLQTHCPRAEQSTDSFVRNINIREGSTRFCGRVVPGPASGFEACFPSRAWSLKITRLRFQRKTKQGT